MVTGVYLYLASTPEVYPTVRWADAGVEAAVWTGVLYLFVFWSYTPHDPPQAQPQARQHKCP